MTKELLGIVNNGEYELTCYIRNTTAIERVGTWSVERAFKLNSFFNVFASSRFLIVYALPLVLNHTHQ